MLMHHYHNLLSLIKYDDRHNNLQVFFDNDLRKKHILCIKPEHTCVIIADTKVLLTALLSVKHSDIFYSIDRKCSYLQMILDCNSKSSGVKHHVNPGRSHCGATLSLCLNQGEASLPPGPETSVQRVDRSGFQPLLVPSVGSLCLVL